MISSLILTSQWTLRASLACAALVMLSVEAEAQAPPEYLSLDGKVVLEGNPLEGNAVKVFNAPVLLLYRCPASAPKGLVMLCPGGGYRWLDMKNEGENTAQFLNAQGFDVALLEYHVMTSPEVRDLAEPEIRAKTQELALADAVKAYRLLRTEAGRLKLPARRVALMGYSAGGHLAARVAQSLPDDEQPTDLILIYPAYLDKTVPGGTAPAVVPPPKPKRLFAMIGDKDNAAWIAGCEAYVKAWQGAGGAATFVLLPGAPHGFGATRLDALKGFLSEAPH